MSENIIEKVWLPSFEIIEPKKERIRIKNVIIRLGVIFSYFIFFSLFISAVLIAVFLGPYGYNPYYNAISDLGWSFITPMPYIFDMV